MTEEEKPDETKMTLTDKEIFSADFPDLYWVIPGLLPEGLTINGAKPKVGKTGITSNLAAAVAYTGLFLESFPVNQSEVLCIFLEDSPRRFKHRFTKILGGTAVDNKMHMAFQWPKLDKCGLEKLDEWLGENPAVKLVIIDTYSRIQGKKANDYDDAYEKAAQLKHIADKYHAAIIINHHCSKKDAEALSDGIMGSTGLVAAVDTIWCMKRFGSMTLLSLTGRDVEEKQLALQFNKDTLAWKVLGSSEEYTLTKARQEILSFLKSQTEPVKLNVIAKAIGKTVSCTANHLSALIREGLVEQPGYGLYKYISVESITSPPSTEVAVDTPADPAELLN